MTLTSLSALGSTASASSHGISLTPLGGYVSGIFNAGAAEIVAHGPVTQHLFAVNARSADVDSLIGNEISGTTRILEINQRDH